MTNLQPPEVKKKRTRSSSVEGELLAAADKILVSEGPDGLTVRAVAACAGVAPMGVYSRFKGKQGLLEALYVQGFEKLRDRVQVSSGATAVDRLRAGCLAYREFALEFPQHYRLMFDHVAEVDPSPDAVEKAYDAFAVLMSIVKDAQASGQVGGASEVEVAQLIWNGLHGGVSLELIGIGFTDDPAQTFADMVDTTLRGLSVPA